MKVQNRGPRNGGMEQIGVDGVAEPPHDNRRDEQRHGKIEILVDQPVSAEYRVERTRDGDLSKSGHSWNLDVALFGGTSEVILAGTEGGMSLARMGWAP